MNSSNTRGIISPTIVVGGSCAVLATSIISIRYWWNYHIQFTYQKYLSELNEKKKKRSLLHTKYKISEIPTEVDDIIIGSGMSGLSCAAILARLGRNVLVLEQHHDVVGGGTHMFDLKGYSFDSGLHYTVPWSIPIFALTCYKKIKDVITFNLMGEADGTVDKIYLVPPDHYVKNAAINDLEPFNMKLHEGHKNELYQCFPTETQAINQFMSISENAMLFVKLFIFSRLLPKWMQRMYWRCIPQRVLNSVGTTAKELLPTLTSNKRLIALLSSMWIDTGARPDMATFMLTAAVFRGVSKEGGCYPAGGSTEMARELVSVIEKFGGKVCIRACVEQILYDETQGRVVGVVMTDGSTIRANRVVSSCSALSTFKYLLPVEVTSKHKNPLQTINIQQSAGFVMCNIGIAASAEDIYATNTNTWHIPVDASYDIFPPLDQYFENPLSEMSEFPAFITFPSLKDSEWSSKHPKKTTCQMLIMAKYEWFEQYKDTLSVNGVTSNNTSRLEGYDELKQQWAKRCTDIFLKYFPKAKDHIELVDISTPLTIENYLCTPRGGAVGLDVTPDRFIRPDIREALDPVTDIKGLYMTGQDTLLCGVTLCQLAGVITAFRMEGLFAAIKIIMQSIFLGD